MWQEARLVPAYTCPRSSALVRGKRCAGRGCPASAQRARCVAQAIYDAKQRTEMDMARREQEMKQLQGAGSLHTPNERRAANRRRTSVACPRPFLLPALARPATAGGHGAEQGKGQRCAFCACFGTVKGRRRCASCGRRAAGWKTTVVIT